MLVLRLLVDRAANQPLHIFILLAFSFRDSCHSGSYFRNHGHWGKDYVSLAFTLCAMSISNRHLQHKQAECIGRNHEYGQ